MKSILLKCSILLVGLALVGCAGGQKPTGKRIADQSAQTKAALSSYPLKTTPVGADTFVISDSEASNATKRVTMSTVAYALSNLGLQLGSLDDLQILDVSTTYTNLVNDSLAYTDDYDEKHLWSIQKVGGELAGKQASDSDLTSLAGLLSGTVTINPGAVSSGACSSAIDGSTATGMTTSKKLMWNFQGDVASTTGYNPSGDLGYLLIYPATDHVYAKFCNKSGNSITPGSITISWWAF